MPSTHFAVLQFSVFEGFQCSAPVFSVPPVQGRISILCCDESCHQAALRETATLVPGRGPTLFQVGAGGIEVQACARAQTARCLQVLRAVSVFYILDFVQFMLLGSPAVYLVGCLDRDLHCTLLCRIPWNPSPVPIISPTPAAGALPSCWQIRLPGHPPLRGQGRAAWTATAGSPPAARAAGSERACLWKPGPAGAPQADPIIFLLRLAPFLFPNVIPDVVPPFSSLPPAHPHAPTTQPPNCQTAHHRPSAKLRQSIYAPRRPISRTRPLGSRQTTSKSIRQTILRSAVANLPAHTTKPRRLFSPSICSRAAHSIDIMGPPKSPTQASKPSPPRPGECIPFSLALA